MKKFLPGFFAFAVLVTAFDPSDFAAAQDPFAENIRATEPLTPEQEQQTFKVPPGFEIQLVAAEPELRKPMNMAFDVTGRLWITESREYPLPAKSDAEARDTIRIFSDFDANGHAQKMTVFATNLNIPIGLYPFRSPSAPGAKPTWKCIAWSIPNIWLFEDTNGDGVADKKEILYGPFDTTRDTHGMIASLRRGFDGWLYGTHGFNNDSHVKGRDGHEVHMQSGNAWRAQLDGSRIEHWTHGQVNPFGLTFDPLGNLFSADCHSQPVYQLLRGAYYPSFGKPHDGLGFAPTTITHSHGSTAIAGIVYVTDSTWPAEFQDNTLIGNVMTSRINRDRIEWRGSTSVGHEMPDFLISSDPWFRPVDLQYGPDGALYVADFYNRIIGHYEVSLTHPGRDRERGRIWRIVPPPISKSSPFYDNQPKTLELAAESGHLLDELLSPNPTRRSLALNELAVRPDANQNDILIGAASGAWHFRQGDSRIGLMSGALWAAERRGLLTEKTLTDALADRDSETRVHALRIITERGTRISAALHSSVVSALQDTNAFVQRAAAEALGTAPSPNNIAPLLELQKRVPAEDTHLAHVVRMALRDQFRAPGAFAKLAGALPGEAESRAIASVAISVTNAEAASFLLRHLQTRAEPPDTLARYAQHAARFAPAGELDSLGDFVRTKFSADLDFQSALFKSIQDGTAQRGVELSSATRVWGAELAVKLLAPADTNPAAWVNSPLDGAKDSRNPWALQERGCADGVRAQLMSSFPNSETLTGTIRSAPFPLPAKLSFYLCGHDGFPGQPAQKKNFVRLIEADTKAVLREAAPPRNDTARKITWDLSEFAGKRGYFEATDGDDGKAYAWLAFGRFEPALPELTLNDASQSSKRQQAGADIARTLKLTSVEPQLVRLLTGARGDVSATGAAARALASFGSNEEAQALAPFTGNASVPASLRENVARAIARKDATTTHAVLLDAMRTVARPLQLALAQSLAGSLRGAEALLKLVSDGQAPAALLLDRIVREKLLAASPESAAKVESLTKNLPPLNDAVQKLIVQRRSIFNVAKVNPSRGTEVFTLVCAACHQIDGKGGLVGPQLDGVGNRGLDRLLEDILDPNANVDRAFRATTFVLVDGEVVTGLFRREEGEQVIVAESTGKETAIPKKQIKERRETERSLMPDNFGDALPVADFNHLIAFLLSKTGREAQPPK